MTSRTRLAPVRRHPSSTMPDRMLLGDVLSSKRADLRRTQESIVSTLRRPRCQTWLSRLENGNFLRLPAWEEFRDLCAVLDLNPVEVLIDCYFILPRERRERRESGSRPAAFAGRRMR